MKRYRKSGSNNRWEALDQENKAISAAKKALVSFEPEVLENGDTLKQLLARSRHLLFKHHDKWTTSQVKRGKLLFERYPLIKIAYNISFGVGEYLSDFKLYA